MGDDWDVLDVEGTDVEETEQGIVYVGSSADRFEDALLRAITRFYKENRDLYEAKEEVDFLIVRAEAHAVIENPPRVGDYKVVVSPKR